MFKENNDSDDDDGIQEKYLRNETGHN